MERRPIRPGITFGFGFYAEDAFLIGNHPIHCDADIDADIRELWRKMSSKVSKTGKGERLNDVSIIYPKGERVTGWIYKNIRGGYYQVRQPNQPFPSYFKSGEPLLVLVTEYLRAEKESYFPSSGAERIDVIVERLDRT